ncbi:MAG: mechanosensitive ion channel family protein [Hydrogenophaga sp.]|uniref:mechanosensitive ion channel family protein n=1 Tax=Hydrogenophaga sp. TaxID=1904254 RepID=UPI0027236EA3|nr:mechanosensitive ion channel family protein [Hydrogenophaga sp.]MDO9568868.1 mechanosensitive ion channel family protein [Hydrogenophaga sp.]MDP3373792.1 mechanosensitive ion channel family protein [Hydrogenophaga sp.]
MNDIAQRLQNAAGLELWLATVLAIAVLTLLANQAVRVLLKHAARWAQRTATHWDEALLNAASKPLRLLVWLVSLGWMARVLNTHWPEPELLASALQWRDIGIILCVAWFLWHFAGEVTETSIRRGTQSGHDFDVTTAMALSKLVRLVVFVVTAITVAHTLGFQIGGLLALGGVGGIAVGLAARDLLANFFGGLTIYLDRPFSVGDWIRSPDKSLEGTVEYISWRHTRIRAFNKNPIYVPNAVFTTIVVENPSRMSHRRLKETLGLRYRDFAQVEAVVADIKAMLLAHEGIDTSQTLIVNFTAFGTSSLDILVYGFTKTTVWVEFHAIKQDVLLRMGRIVAAHGAEIAFPTQTLHVATPAPTEPPQDGPPTAPRALFEDPGQTPAPPVKPP